ncbi:MAG: thioredoxin family protein [Bacteroidales bacterium]|nr:thioredoxin family protein [Bacteroidales bacterium]
MKRKTLQQILPVMIVMASLFINGCGHNPGTETKQEAATVQVKDDVKPRVTFIELGSVRCIPCQQMQPIMKSVEEKFGSQVKVVFYDVWTPEGSPYADKYGVQAIPTQVFLDENGVEYARHVGFFPEDELIEVLKQKGVE